MSPLQLMAAAQQRVAPAPNLYGLTGAGMRADSGGYRIDGRRVLDTYNPVTAAMGARTEGVGEGAIDYAAQPASFNPAVEGVFDQSFADRQGFGDLWRSGYRPGGGSGEDRYDASYSPELLDRLSQYQVARLGFGDDMRQFAVLDKDSGNVVGSTAPKAYSGFKDFAKMAVPMMLGVAAPGLGASLGKMAGLSGTAASVAGNAALSGGLSKLTGGDFMRGALTGGLSAFAAPALGKLASTVTSATSGLGDTLSAALGGASKGLGNAALRSLVSGQGLSSDALLRGLLTGGTGAGVNSAFGGGPLGQFAAMMASRAASNAMMPRSPQLLGGLPPQLLAYLKQRQQRAPLPSTPRMG